MARQPVADRRRGMNDMSEWLSPEQLASELTRPDQVVTVAWVRDQMARGAIPSVKVGRRRWFTPDCRAELSARMAAATRPADRSGFGVKSRAA